MTINLPCDMDISLDFQKARIATPQMHALQEEAARRRAERGAPEIIEAAWTAWSIKYLQGFI